jgi:structural maintenance of chromosome 4
MRLNKLSELIHKSAEHGDCQTASVRVFFTDIIDQEDDPDAFTEVEGSQFTVSRVVNRASTSKYFINNTAVDYKEVCDLLQTKGIDLEHNRFLIL